MGEKRDTTIRKKLKQNSIYYCIKVSIEKNSLSRRTTIQRQRGNRKL